MSKAEADVAVKAFVQRAMLVGRCARISSPVGPFPDEDTMNLGGKAENSRNAAEEPNVTKPQESPNPTYLPRELRGLSTDALEDFARRDFAAAGRYGDTGAAEIARKLDPYARLCGGVVREAMRAEMLGG